MGRDGQVVHIQHGGQFLKVHACHLLKVHQKENINQENTSSVDDQRENNSTFSNLQLLRIPMRTTMMQLTKTFRLWLRMRTTMLI